jgi:hypothetical protein
MIEGVGNLQFDSLANTYHGDHGHDAGYNAHNGQGTAPFGRPYATKRHA